MVTKHLSEKCEAFGIGYFGDDPECGDCDVARICRGRTDALNKKTEDEQTMSLEKLLKEAKKLKKKGDLKDFIEEHELEVSIKKSDTVAKILKKIESALEDEFDEEVEDVEDEDEVEDDDDAGEDDDDEGVDDDDDEGEEAEEAEEIDVEELVERITALETRVAELTDKMGEAKAAPSGASKAAIKKEKIAALMEGVPYSDDDLDELNGRELKLLASGLGINSFGMNSKKVTAAIKKIQGKKATGKKAGKKGKKGKGKKKK